MNKEFIARISAENNGASVLFGKCIKQIVWDNCEGGYATMANVGQIVYLTKNNEGSHSAHFDYGDYIISDYIGVDEAVEIVSESEAEMLDSEYRKKCELRSFQARLARMDPYDDLEDFDRKVDDLYEDVGFVDCIFDSGDKYGEPIY